MRTRKVTHGIHAGDARAPLQRRPDAGVPLSALLDRWMADQIITPEQAAQMTLPAEVGVNVEISEQPVPDHRSPLVVESLGYLGGAIVVAASMLIAARYWGDFASAWRLTVLGGVTLSLLVCGAAVPVQMAAVGDRLRSILWLASTAASAGFLTVLAVDRLDVGGDDLTLLVASGTTAYTLGLWLRSPTPAQQTAMMAALAVAASALIAQAGVDHLPGLGAWAVGLVWALFGWRGLLKPARFATSVGSATAIVGAMLTAGSDAGTVLTLVTVLAVVGAAIAIRDLLLLGVGILGLLVNLPAVITRWFPDSPVVPYLLLLLGALLVVVAVRVARRTPEGRAAPRGRAGM